MGGRGGGSMAASTSTSASGSGTFPAASLSKILSPSPSIELIAGAGGSGLFTSEGVAGRCFDGDADGEEEPPVGLVLPGEDAPGFPSLLFLLFTSPLISFPWREFGGRGFFRRVEGDPGDFAGAPLTRPSWSSSPGSDISCEVRGDSGGRAASNTDCFEIDDASVILAPSPDGREAAFVAAAPAVAAAAPPPPSPARSNSLKACTSRDPFPAPAGAFSSWPPSFILCSTSSKVFWNGLGGGRWDACCDAGGGVGAAESSPSDPVIGDGVPLNGSTPGTSSSSLLVPPPLLVLSSPSSPAGYVSVANDTDSGDEGGGDCTRTRLTTLGFWKLVDGGGCADCGSVWRWLRKKSLEEGKVVAGGGSSGASGKTDGDPELPPAVVAAEGALAEVDEELGAAALRRKGLLEPGVSGIVSDFGRARRKGEELSRICLSLPTAVFRTLSPGEEDDGSRKSNQCE